MKINSLWRGNNPPEILARGLVILLVVGLVVVVSFTRWESKFSPSRTITIHARMPEDGGWSPGDLDAQVGETLHLRLTSDDVMHGFALGGSSIPDNPISVDVEPGKVTEVDLTFDKSGKYTFYCTRWCGLNHWRMRGTIQVSGPVPESVDQVTPLYLSLGLDLDAPHPAAAIPKITPSAARGADLSIPLPGSYQDLDYYRTHSPAEIWQDLRAESGLKSLDDSQVWDLVAYIWSSNTTTQALQEGQALYATNCSACHGETGTGDGVMAEKLTSLDGSLANEEHETGHRTVQPADFTSMEDMLGASPALLQGKILRGGMGTGMPYWGPILTEPQTWALVDYLFTFQFQK
jgi:mono/diheme cytochrome c family protein/plastocyanin